MNNVDIVMYFWQAIDKQQWGKLRSFFSDSAIVAWPNTNEIFVDINNYIRANSEYPGNWNIDVERIEEVDNKIITVTKVSSREEDVSFYAVSFFEITNGRVDKLTEYWGENSQAPEWRIKLNLTAKNL